MGLSRGSHSSTDVSSSLQGEINPSDLAAPQSVEYDEIPLGSSSEESQSSSDAHMSDSGSDDETEAQGSSLISTGNEHIPIQPHLPVSTAAPVHVLQQEENLSRKRKSLGAADTISYTAVSVKKVKLDEEQTACLLDKSLLPAEIWHRIFTFTPPKTLGNLLCVNKLFNAYLDPISCYRCEFSPFVSQTTSTLKPDAIWQLSRRRFWPRMPAPLMWKTELDMWRLVCGKTCQFCGKAELTSPKSPRGQLREKPLHIWAFALRSCGSCLVENTIKEIDLLLSSSVPSVLIPALPFVLTTSETHTISPDALQRGLIPPDLQVTKIYLSEHVGRLKQEFLSVKSMGGATVEEWLKGLELRGKELLSDSMRWEKWSSNGGITQLSQNSVPNANISSEDNSVSRKPSLQHGTHSNPPRARTREEALELKAARRVEIERRAMELDPPLTPSILALIPSFQAAIQIISPLDDNAWKLLKPRLLSQRVDAEKSAEKDAEQDEPGDPRGTAQPHLALERTEERPHEEGNIIATKQLVDKTWDDVQAPLRARISAYADEIIQDGWGNGQKVDTENSPQFAAEVLLYVRQRFYTEIAKESIVTQAAGQQPVQDPPGGPFTQKLTLENMRWLFDVKIKPHTESYRKDLFFCNGCEVSFKAFGFEGVIQHYAAKHTNILSLGSVVVHWRAEWPEIPPFKPNPQDIKISDPSAGSLYNTSRSQTNTGFHRHNPNPYSLSSHTSSFTVPPLGFGHLGHGPLTQHPIPYAKSNMYAPGQQDHSSLFAAYTSHGATYQPFPPGVYSTPPAYPPMTNIYPSHNHNAYQANFQTDYQISSGSSLAGKYHAQLEYLARSARELWTATAGLKELPGSIRVYVVIHHIVQRFQYRFSESPPLAMFIDGLSNNKEMRPVRNINGLICKACHLGLGTGTATDQDRRTFSLPQLVNHFQQNHVDHLQSMGVPFLDWAVHMVHTPDLSVLSNLRHLANMDNQKISLISDAFPPTQYPASYPQGVSTSSNQDAWANVSITPYFGQHSAYSAPIQDSSQCDASSRWPVTGYGAKTPCLQDRTQSPTLGQNSDVHPPAVIANRPSTTHQKTQLGDSGRSSSESRAERNGIKPKKQKGNHNKDRRNMSGQDFKNRKGGGGTAIARRKSQESNGEGLVAEEERRQEEEIRAMWAADRADAARLASRNQRLVEAEEPEARQGADPNTRTVQASGSPPYSNQVRGHQPDIIRDREEVDLMAGLESQLDQQRVLSETFRYRSRYAVEASHEQPRYGHIYPSQGVSSVSPGYARREVGPHANQHRDRSPSSRPEMESIHESTRAVTTLDNALYNQVHRQGYSHPVYADDSRVRQNAPQYAEAYELIRARDSQGEYFIRRPVRLEQEQRYAASDDGRGGYRDAAPQYSVYENDERSRIETSVRQATCKSGIMSEGTTKKHVSKPLPIDDIASYEDYDPRFPAALPSSNRQQVQHH
ncbi:hypothetical protein F4818DRAFT_431516 [Hypoxylon cercidicola]|nr:hypothetical protein F4818DRAFT_431516 [Hypoxylon cercidicola]